MKIKDGFILKEMAGSWVVVPLGEKLVNFEMMMTLNETGAFLWEQLKEDKPEEELVAALLAEYNVEKEVAANDVSEFVQKLKEKEVL
ncbi:MAG: PqqD family protein [Clostridia bacterium]|nr:PqqD family protein [Clostridia bacterium]